MTKKLHRFRFMESAVELISWVLCVLRANMKPRERREKRENTKVEEREEEEKTPEGVCVCVSVCVYGGDCECACVSDVCVSVYMCV